MRSRTEDDKHEEAGDNENDGPRDERSTDDDKKNVNDDLNSQHFKVCWAKVSTEHFVSCSSHSPFLASPAHFACFTFFALRCGGRRRMRRGGGRTERGAWKSVLLLLRLPLCRHTTIQQHNDGNIYSSHEVNC